MDRVPTKSVGDVLRDLFRDSCMEQELLEQRAVGVWQYVVGDYIAGQCRRPIVAKGIMKIGVPNPSLRHELTMSRSGIIASINNILKRETIKEIRFIS